MRVKYSFVCDAANIANNGNLNVLGIFRNIFAQQFPATHPKMTYVAGLEFHRSEIGSHAFKLAFIDEDGRELIPSVQGEMNVNDAGAIAHIMLDLNNIIFPKAGAYAIDLIVDNHHASTDDIVVMQMQK